MTYTATVVQVLLSSPSDLPPEHRDLIHSTIRAWNTNYSRRFGVLFSPTDWQEGVSPSYGQEPQAFINDQLVASSDMGLVVFTSRLGTPTKTHSSGTVEEIALLHSQGKRVAILRNMTPSSPISTTEAIQQLAALDAVSQFNPRQGALQHLLIERAVDANYQQHVEQRCT